MEPEKSSSRNENRKSLIPKGSSKMFQLHSIRKLDKFKRDIFENRCQPSHHRRRGGTRKRSEIAISIFLVGKFIELFIYSFVYYIK